MDYTLSRSTTCELIEMAEEGRISWESLARDMLSWLSEGEVHQMAEHNGYIVYDDDEDEE